MRIDAYSKIGQLYQTSKVKPTAKKPTTVKSDKIEISDFGQSLAIAKQAVNDAPDVRMERVEELKARIAAGNYYVSNEEIAGKMVEQYYS